MSLEDEIEVLKQTVRQWEEEEAFYGAPCRPKELAAMRAVLARLEQDAAHTAKIAVAMAEMQPNSASSPVEGMAAPGDTTERARKILRDIFPWPYVKDEKAIKVIAASLTAAEDGARRAAQVIEAARALVAQTRYVVGLPDGDPYKGTGNRLADALAEYDRAQPP